MGNAAAVRPEGADFCSPFQKSSRSHLGRPRLSGLFPPLATALPEEMGPVGTHGRALRSALQRGLGLCLGSQAVGLRRQEDSSKLVRAKCL